MRVTDLIPWKTAPGSETAMPGGRDPVAALQSDVNRAFDDFLRVIPMPFSGWASSFPDSGSRIPVDVTENDKEMKVTAELPGMDETDIDVRVNDGMLIIAGEKKTDREINEDGYVLRECSVGRVERALPLPEGVDADAVQANFKRGVLTLTIPKKPDAQGGAKRIPVRSS
jgi:HSP20 family protein